MLYISNEQCGEGFSSFWETMFGSEDINNTTFQFSKNTTDVVNSGDSFAFISKKCSEKATNFLIYTNGILKGVPSQTENTVWNIEIIDSKDSKTFITEDDSFYLSNNGKWIMNDNNQKQPLKISKI